MNQDYFSYERKIKRKHSFAFTPNFEESFAPQISPRVVVEIAEKVADELDWQIIYKDQNTVEMLRQNDLGKDTNKITVSAVDKSNVSIKSTSISGIWDSGGNSKRVKLFKFVFDELLKNYGDDSIMRLEKELESKDNWDDYVIPENLPKPKKTSQPNILIPIICISITSVIIAYIIAFLTFQFSYIIGLYEVGAGFALGYLLIQYSKLGNFTDINKIKLIIGGSVLLTYIFTQYFLYKIISQSNDISASFMDFISHNLKQGLSFKALNLGTIGLIALWAYQLVMTFIIAQFKAFHQLIKFVIDRVPIEVTEFAMYHFIKGKTEAGVKQELSKKGWKTELEQKMVFESIDGIQGGIQLNREI